VNLAAEAPQWLALILAILLIAAASEDAVRLRISNVTVLLLLIAAVVAAAVVGLRLAVWQNLLVFAVLLAIGTPMFAAGKLGGGDVKLLAATGLWFDLGGALRMVVAVAIAGGILAIVVLTLRTFGWSQGVRDRVVLLRPRSGIPYGVAIAAGALLTVLLQR
jgi:prepilin peptidase CpaA